MPDDDEDDVDNITNEDARRIPALAMQFARKISKNEFLTKLCVM